MIEPVELRPVQREFIVGAPEPINNLILAACVVVESLRCFDIGLQADADILAGALADLGIVVGLDGAPKMDSAAHLALAVDGRKREFELLKVMEAVNRERRLYYASRLDAGVSKETTP